jgi:hypothetical protein
MNAAAADRAAAPAAVPEEIKARNAAALAKRKAAIAEAKAAEAAKALPEGWRRVESNSRPGEYVYENIHTEERQAWFPTVAAVEEVAAAPVAASAGTDAKAALKAKNAEALAKRKAAAQAQKAKEAKLALPAGWTRTESRSRPGEVVYENEVTGERQAWFPDAPAEGMSPEELAKKEVMKKNKAALEKRKKALGAKKAEDAKKPLPEGWKRVESRSRPGEFVYENLHTEERQAWFPDGPAAKPLPDGWRKVESRSFPGEFVYENMHTFERQAWVPGEEAPKVENQIVAPAAPAAGEPEPAAEAVVICQAKALYDYKCSPGKEDEELDLMENDIIDVEYKADNGWWVGKNTRSHKSGIFPGTYVEQM